MYNKGRLALKQQLHVSGTRMIFPSIVAGGFVAFIATQLRMSSPHQLYSEKRFFAAFDSKKFAESYSKVSYRGLYTWYS